MPAQTLTQDTQSPSLIAAFGDRDGAVRAVRALRGQGMSAELIAPSIDSRGPRRHSDVVRAQLDADVRMQPKTASGMIIGSVWGFLVATLIINFLAVNPSMTVVFAVTSASVAGGSAVGGFFAAFTGGTPDLEVFTQAGAPLPAESFLAVRTAEDGELDRAMQLLEHEGALDIADLRSMPISEG
jgi:hypothetical protein